MRESRRKRNSEAGTEKEPERRGGKDGRDPGPHIRRAERGWGGAATGGRVRADPRSRGAKAEGTPEGGAHTEPGARSEIPGPGARRAPRGPDERGRRAGTRARPGPPRPALRAQGVSHAGEHEREPPATERLPRIRRRTGPESPPGRGLVLSAHAAEHPWPHPPHPRTSSPGTPLQAAEGGPVRDDPRCRR